eukprot:Em0001g767a
MLRDRLVCGLRDVRVQRRLFAEPKLTFTKAFELAQAAELAEKCSQDISRAGASVNALGPRKATAGQTGDHPTPCFRCGGRHSASKCRFRSVECHKCGEKGHLARTCRSKEQTVKKQFGNSAGKQSTNLLAEPLEEDEDVEDMYTLFNVRDVSLAPFRVPMEINKASLEMEVDTGAAASVISEVTYRTLWKGKCNERPPLKHTNALLRTYTGERLRILGRIAVQVRYQKQEANLSLLVIGGDGPSLLGRDWIGKFRFPSCLNRGIFHTSSQSALQEILGKHKELFKDELGLLKGTLVKIHVNETATPLFFKPRAVPYAVREKVEKELERLEKLGVIEAIQFSEWAAPVVPVVKCDGSIRLCGDYKLTVNRVANLECYPLPRIDDLLASLGKGKIFSKLDLANAYLQLALEDESKKYVTITTHKGLYRYNRLPFGVASAPAIFQRTMENLLRDISNVVVYLDDILVSGSTEAEHLHTLDRVMSRLEEHGLHLKLSKCVFMAPSVEYLGHHISADGIRPAEGKKRAIEDAPRPQNVGQLRSFVGLLNYYGKFLPNMADILAPLYRLLRKGASWCWEAEQDAAFNHAKQQLSSFSQRRIQGFWKGGSNNYIHKRGWLKDGSERPIAYASRTLAPAEAKYSQIEKEGLAIIFGVKKFHQYLVGRSFTIYSDHKPLQYLFSPFLGKMFMVVVDAHSKWLDVAVVTTPSSQQAIKILRNLFATHGLPEMVVSDNGSAFTSAEFQTFVKRNGIRHVRSAPYHPSSNGQAERVVQTFKEAILKTTGDLDARLARFIFQYRLTPHTTTGLSPAEMLLGRRPRSHLDLLHPDISPKVTQRQERQKEAHDQHAKYRKFQNGDLVYARNFHGSPTWVPGVVTAMSGPVSMVIQLEDGQAVRRHTDHIKARSTTSEPQVPKTTTAVQQDDIVDLPDIQEEAATRDEEGPPMVDIPVPLADAVIQAVPEPIPNPVPLRRSTRYRLPPDRL